MDGSFRLLLVVGFLFQVIGNRMAANGMTLLPGGFPPLYLMIAGIIVFTLGSVLYARAKGRLWTWGLFGIILPFFLIVVLIPRRGG